MAQVTIYLDKETEEKMRIYTKAENISQSKWVASLIRERLQSEWPSHVAELAGAWEDFPSLEELRDMPASDMPRDTM